MNILMKMKLEENFSKNEEALRDYILEHPVEVLDMNSKDLASACFVSVATIYRLCDKLELSGYADLKLKISSALPDYKTDDDFDYNFPVAQYQTHHEILNSLKED